MKHFFLILPDIQEIHAFSYISNKCHFLKANRGLIGLLSQIALGMCFNKGNGLYITSLV